MLYRVNRKFTVRGRGKTLKQNCGSEKKGKRRKGVKGGKKVKGGKNNNQAGPFSYDKALAEFGIPTIMTCGETIDEKFSRSTVEDNKNYSLL